jgi:hypothetical protein
MPINVRIAIFDLSVEISTTHDYPDALDDMTQRAINAFTSSLITAKSVGIDLMPILEEEYVEEEEAEAETETD